MMKGILLTLLLWPSLTFAGAVDFEAQRSIIQDHSVIILGENHEDLQTKQSYPEVVTEIQRIDSSYNCLSLEFSSVMQTQFENVSSTTEYKNFLNTYLLAIPYYESIYSPLPAAQQVSFLTNFYTFFVSWFHASEAIRQGGGKTYLVDDLTLQSNDPVQTMVFRNRQMGTRISDLLKSGECTKVIAINGAEHISTWHGLNLIDYVEGQKAFGFLLTDVYLPDSRTVRIDILRNTN
jgi:hypothetical protein